MMRCDCGRPRRDMDKLCVCARYDIYLSQVSQLMGRHKAYYAETGHYLSTLYRDMHEEDRIPA